MGATLSKLSSVTSRNSLRSDFPNTVPSSMPSPTSSPPSSPIRSIPWRQSRSGRLSHEKPITRVIVRHALMPTVLAGIDVAAKRRRAAGLDRRHDLELGQAQGTGLSGTIAGSLSPEDGGDLEWGAQAGSVAGILALHQQRQMLERTGHRADRLGC